ncbi:PEP-CTERM sorting domain-containing protein [uncultured Thiodictyon sp.]|uniref:PEP-CTERM sorting domain-containing protein n=1 Tax=uncultured Thiodictyon sp. TaxID=1846217 RepID=UPI0025E5FEAB|nr:PEP-CTERM sorting domain-containing protein [uncultured Thiodictyon sp.]
MKPNTITGAVLAASLLLGAVASGSVYAIADLVVDRGLPIINLNNAAGIARSNISWTGFEAQWFTGDTFYMPETRAGQPWTIDTIRIWSPAMLVSESQLKDHYSSISLYADLYDATGVTPFTQRSQGNIISGNQSDNSSITFTKVTYADASNSDYQSSGGQVYQLWQVDFTNLNWVVSPSQWIQFGVDATGPDMWYTHASNAALSGSTQQDADGAFTYIDRTNLLTMFDCDSAPGSGTSAFCSWNKSSDLNVQVFATPAPGSLALALIGLFGLSAARRGRA